MMPSFLYPAFLIGAAAAAIPVLLHLLRNQQAPELRFSAVRLLRGVRVEHAQRRRIRDWLLLALRVSALLLLAFAFARPYFVGTGAAPGDTMLLVIDRSASMSPPAVWEQARAAALRAIHAGGAGEPIGLIAFDDRPELIVEPTIDRAALRGALDRIAPGVGATGYAGALARAAAVLEDADRRSGRIVVISDLQGSSADVRVSLPESVKLDVVNVPAPFENVALLGAREAEGGLVATVRNDGSAPRRLRLQVSGTETQPAGVQLEVPPGQTVEAPIPGPAREGEVLVEIDETEGNALRIDDKRYLRLRPARRPRVLVIAAGDDAFYVDAALRAGESRPDFDVVTIAAQGITQALSGNPAPEAVLVLGPRGLDRGGRDALLRFARNGGGVLVAASDPGFSLLLDGLEVSAPAGDEALLTLASFDSRHPLFRDQGMVAGGLSNARFTRAWRVRGREWQMLARFDNGAGALFERAEGRGRILFFASDLNRGWNDLPVLPAFVPFVHGVARYLAPPDERREYTPGTLPSGTPPRLGFLDLASGRRVSVNPDVRESDPARMEAAAFSAAVKRRPDRQVDESVLQRRAESTERGQALWRYGLMLMFATLVAEGIIASRVRRV